MARPGLTRHRKFIRLARVLRSRALALGHLELIWEGTYESGDDYLGDATDVEALADWQGEHGALCMALLTAGGEGCAGFIEEIEGRPGFYRIHDLYDHAPEYVRKRMDREAARSAKGKTLSDVRAEAASKRWEKVKQTAASVESDASACTANGTTPAPAPAPAPAQEDLSSASADLSAPGPKPEDLQKLWNERAPPRCPRWVQMPKARKRAAEARLSDHKGSVGWFAEVLQKIASSPFLRGEKTDFAASPDWILKPANLAKVLEGNYDATGAGKRLGAEDFTNHGVGRAENAF